MFNFLMQSVKQQFFTIHIFTNSNRIFLQSSHGITDHHNFGYFKVNSQMHYAQVETFP